MSWSVKYLTLISLSSHICKMAIIRLSAHSIFGGWGLNQITYTAPSFYLPLKNVHFFPIASFLCFPPVINFDYLKASPKVLLVLFPTGLLKCQVGSRFSEICIVFVKEPWKHIHVTEDPNFPSSNQVVVLGSPSQLLCTQDINFTMTLRLFCTQLRSTQNTSSLIPWLYWYIRESASYNLYFSFLVQQF